jgi:hypothetical protein
MSGTWSIEFAEKPLDSIGNLDNVIFNGKNASHSFLRLVDPQGQVVGELHGLSVSGETGEAQDVSFNALGRLGYMLNQNKDKAPYKPDRLQIFTFEGWRTKSSQVETYTLKTGSEREIKGLWNIGCEAAKDFNAKNYEYTPIGLDDLQGPQLDALATKIPGLKNMQSNQLGAGLLKLGAVVGNAFTGVETFIGKATNCHTASSYLIKQMRLECPPLSRFARPGFDVPMAAAFA